MRCAGSEAACQGWQTEWAERFDAEGVWWARAQTPAEVVEDRQLVDNDGFVTVGGGALRSVNGPVSFSDVVAEPDRGVPRLGEHTVEVLKDLAGRAGPDPVD